MTKYHKIKMTFDEFLKAIENRESMYVGSTNYDLVVNFIAGVDWGLHYIAGYGDSCLEGMQEWVNLRENRWLALSWTNRIVLGCETEEQKLSRLFSVIREFRADLEKIGLEEILQKHRRRFSSETDATNKT